MSLFADTLSPLWGTLPGIFQVGHTQVFLLTCLVALMTYRWLSHHSHGDRKLPPGPWGFPVIGHLPLLGSKPHLTLTDMSRKYGSVFRLRMGSRPTVVINGLEMIREALIGQAEVFAGRPDFYSFRFLAEGVSMAFGPYDERWKVHKRLARGALRMFTQSPDYGIEDKILEEADVLIREFLSTDGHPTDPKNNVQLASGSIIYTICFGSDYKLRERDDFVQFMKNNRAFQELQKAGGNPADLMPWLIPLTKGRMKPFIELIASATAIYKIQQQEHKATYNPKRLRDVTDALIKAAEELDQSEMAKSGLTQKHINNTVYELIGAGLNTVTVTLRWALLYMAKYPEIQARVQRQLDEVVGGDRWPRYADRAALPLVEATLAETWRCSDHLPFLLPHSTTADTHLAGYFIPKDTFVMFNMRSASRDPTAWQEQDRFWIDRFLDPSSGELDRNKAEAVMAFGAGKRRCVGEFLGRQQSFVFLACLLQRCRFQELPEQPINDQGRFGFAVDPLDHVMKITARDF